MLAIGTISRLPEVGAFLYSLATSGDLKAPSARAESKGR